MKDKPSKILVAGFFYLNERGDPDLKDIFVHAWRNIYRNGKDQLGKKNYVAFEPYTQWVHARACELKMPCPLERPSQPFIIKSSSTIPIENREEFQEILGKIESKLT